MHLAYRPGRSGKENVSHVPDLLMETAEAVEVVLLTRKPTHGLPHPQKQNTEFHTSSPVPQMPALSPNRLAGGVVLLVFVQVK